MELFQTKHTIEVLEMKIKIDGNEHTVKYKDIDHETSYTQCECCGIQIQSKLIFRLENEDYEYFIR